MVHSLSLLLVDAPLATLQCLGEMVSVFCPVTESQPCLAQNVFGRTDSALLTGALYNRHLQPGPIAIFPAPFPVHLSSLEHLLVLRCFVTLWASFGPLLLMVIRDKDSIEVGEAGASFVYLT